ncbi:ATP-binding protein involved in chromosome partitioning [Sphingobium sp. B2D3A]|uniref:Mrp/NBP35 family ATP-binding protein n=1 Tax=unclassified Sphingobium TaxID=2611147 RepID=UPI0029CAC3DE|nr:MULTISPECIES: Mrp/NBP35 family ATP-binding protein [unclassified Sphingobium]MCW2336431.1 ATP-binding protein involved in chromosome partitioning [Sphingobium sp. B2D3A]MCW2383253.1 ATP-binding protein involved in chromosome partitioning [Sphingobium sp. B2D3B]MCW2386185.1 ATP-binding protein involved in chromosome partitioning [Sphingobium sp. B2D3D]MCW2399772.1 ATP-binding protein involved in chromosome partitioning [Sphingobium sp. B2D3C]MCW2410496.1 ATP-binding protein involved in chrom
MTDSPIDDASALPPALTARIEGLAAGRAGGLRLRDNVLSLVLDVSGLDAEQRDSLAAQLVAAGTSEFGLEDVRVAMTAERAARPTIIAVGSGKGGVGKSTLSVNLAVALKALGKRVGMVDADIYGPSLPRLLDSEDAKPKAEGNRLFPVQNAYGIPMLSMGHLAKKGQAIAWRGPMAGNALGQLLDADWQGIDLLVVDLPPGTGDVQLTMIQRYKPAGAVIISTPQDLALIDATRAVSFFDQAKVPVIGMVENMAGYVCPHCGEVSDPFGSGGAEASAAQMGLPFLGRVPLDIAVRTASDAGKPPAADEGVAGQPFRAIAERVARWLDRNGSGATAG